MTITDTVAYHGLIPGKKYTVTGTMMDKETGKAVTSGGAAVTSSAEFTAESADGTIELTFTFDGSHLAGKTIVAFESVSYKGKEIAVHADIEDEAQTIIIPKIGTTVKDSETKDHTAYADDKIELIDTVSYENLTPGTTYRIKGTLMDKETKEALQVNGQEVKAETEITPEGSAGTVDVTFAFDGKDLAGKDLVVFERAFLVEGTVEGEIANHEDINDEGQTIHLPKIGTQAKDAADNDQVLKPDKKVKVTDTVSYQNLIKDQKYTVKGTLMDQETGKAVENDGKPVTAEAEFKAKDVNGEVEVSFTFDASDLGGYSLVVFEKLYFGEVQIAAHEDLKDKAQTVTVEKPEEPEKPETPKQTVTPDTPTKKTTTTTTESTVSKTSRPKTGDDMSVVLFTVLLIGAGAGITGVGVAKKKGLL